MTICNMSESAKNKDYFIYDIIEYPTTMDSVTGNNEPEVMLGCIHTATLAVCTVLVIFVLFLGCTGNGIVLFNALTTQRLRSNFDLLIINLAGADFIMCTCLSPIFLFLLFSESAIPKVFCGSVLFLGMTSGSLSLLSLVSIAIHRHCRIVGRLRRPLTLPQTSAIVGLVWLISIALALGSTFQLSESWGETTIGECQNTINTKGAVTKSFVLYFLSPVTTISLTIISTCYVIIARIVRTESSKEHAVPPVRTDVYSDEMNCEVSSDDNQNSGHEITVKYPLPDVEAYADNVTKAVTMCVVVVLTVTLCWAPLITSQFIELFTGESIILYQVKLCGIALIFLNSALDPYIYGQMNTRVKHKYARMLYSFARCEYAFQQTTKLTRPGPCCLEECPLNLSPQTHDTNSVAVGSLSETPVYTKRCKKQRKRKTRSSHKRCYQNYTQNLLLANYPIAAAHVTQLCQDNSCHGDSVPVKEAEHVVQCLQT